MSRGSKKRIDVNPIQSGLNQAFAGLDVPNLPTPPVPSPLPSAGPPAIHKPGRVILRRETAHRGGKTVIIVHDFATHISLNQIEALAKRLRSQCGCGGTVRDRTIEIQGEHAGKIRKILQTDGFTVAGVE